MRNVCLRCGYMWNARSSTPLRCPGCKSVRWNKKVVKDTCLRCGAEWMQRGDETPKYCPICHSSMWNSVKRTYTCPRCGKTRTLKSNSRIDLCPQCDEYFDPPAKIPNTETRSNENGIAQIIHLWTNGKGMVLNYTQNDNNLATLYNRGKLIGTINISAWCRNQGVAFNKNAVHQEEKLQKIYESAVDKIIQTSAISEDRISNVSTLRQVTPEEAEIISLYESGMEALPISLKLGIPFTKVMDVLSSVPPIRSQGLDRTPKEDKLAENRARTSKIGQNV